MRNRSTHDELSFAAKEILRNDSPQALFLAVGVGLDKIVERILLRGSVSANVRNPDGATALHVAAIGGFSSTCKVLHSFGGDVNAMWDGSTPLHLAASESRNEVIPVLIGLGAALNTPDSLGFTPLHLVAIRGNRTLAAYLIQAGADPLLRDGDGKTVAERWNFSSQLPSLHAAENELDPPPSFSSSPPEVHSAVSEPALLKVFRAFETFHEERRAEPITPEHYGMKYYRSMHLEELEKYLRANVDNCGLPPSAVAKKVESLLAPAKKRALLRAEAPSRIYFDDFCLLWLKAQSMGLV